MKQPSYGTCTWCSSMPFSSISKEMGRDGGVAPPRHRDRRRVATDTVRLS